MPRGKEHEVIEGRMGPQGKMDSEEFNYMADMSRKQHADIAEMERSGADPLTGKPNPPGLPLDEPPPQNLEDLVHLGIIDDGTAKEDPSGQRQRYDDSMIPNEDGSLPEPKSVRSVVDQLKSEKEKRQALEEENRSFKSQFETMKNQMNEMRYLINMGASNLHGGVPPQTTAPGREPIKPPDPNEIFNFGEIKTTEEGAVTADGLKQVAAQLMKGMLKIQEYKDSLYEERVSGVEDAFRHFGTDQFMKETEKLGGFPSDSHRGRTHKALTDAMVRMLPQHMKRDAAMVAKNLFISAVDEDLKERDIVRDREATEKKRSANFDLSPVFSGGRGGFEPKILRAPRSYEEADQWSYAMYGSKPSTR